LFVLTHTLPLAQLGFIYLSLDIGCLIDFLSFSFLCGKGQPAHLSCLLQKAVESLFFLLFLDLNIQSRKVQTKCSASKIWWTHLKESVLRSFFK
jgi:hypothetical protein